MEQMLLRGLAALLALLTALWFVWGARFAVGLPGALAFALSVLGWLWVAALFALAWRQGQSKGPKQGVGAGGCSAHHFSAADGARVVLALASRSR